MVITYILSKIPIQEKALAPINLVDLVEQFEYDIEIIDNGGIFQLDKARNLTINRQDIGNAVELKKKKNSESLLTIPLKDVETAREVTVQSKHMLVKKDNIVIEIIFRDNQGSIQNKKTIRFDLDDKYISIVTKQINLLKDIANNESFRKAIAIRKNSKLCSACAENKYSYTFSLENLCLACFEHKYGKILLTSLAHYYGGHKAYLAGGVFTKFQNGLMYLTENYLIFVRRDKDVSKSWEIIIPLNAVVVENWYIEEVARRQDVSGLATSMGTSGNFGYGSGTIHDSGKAHHLVVPYKDENGIPQAPKFGVSSFRGKAIREWASKLYDQVVKVRNENIIHSENVRLIRETQLTTDTIEDKRVQTNDDDPIKVLKIRFAKGEISKEQYEEMRKMIES